MSPIFRKDKIALFQKSHFVLFPSIMPERFGLVVLEALSAGLPVICTNKGGPVEIINSDVGLSVDTQNIEELKSALEFMIKLVTTPKYFKMCENARLLAKKYTWFNTAKKYIMLIDEMQNKNKNTV